MKVTKPAYEWTGEHRPPKKGEFFLSAQPRDGVMMAEYDWGEPRDIYREVPREHEVPDQVPPVPEWYLRARLRARSLGGDAVRHWDDVSDTYKRILAEEHRAHVESRAKAAADKIASFGHVNEHERIIREVFLA